MNDIDGWDGPEQLGLRRDECDTVTIARRGGIVVLLLASLCGVSGTVALVLTTAASRNRHG
jgi:hypothetical protein